MFIFVKKWTRFCLFESLASHEIVSIHLHIITVLFVGCYRCFTCCTISSQSCHPSHGRIDIVASNHVHYLTSILLSVFVFELAVEAFVCILDEGVSHLILALRREDLGAWQTPWLVSIELGGVLVGTQVHTEG